jgi:hypothetical protein
LRWSCWYVNHTVSHCIYWTGRTQPLTPNW